MEPLKVIFLPTLSQPSGVNYYWALLVRTEGESLKAPTNTPAIY